MNKVSTMNSLSIDTNINSNSIDLESPLIVSKHPILIGCSFFKKLHLQTYRCCYNKFILQLKMIESDKLCRKN